RRSSAASTSGAYGLKVLDVGAELAHRRHRSPPLFWRKVADQVGHGARRAEVKVEGRGAPPPDGPSPLFDAHRLSDRAPEVGRLQIGDPSAVHARDQGHARSSEIARCASPTVVRCRVKVVGMETVGDGELVDWDAPLSKVRQHDGHPYPIAADPEMSGA